jgi:3-oxoacyl-[acyl-carrier protein] reductase
MDLNLRDKVAIVTGGSRGLGRAICLALAEEGVRLAINYRSRTEPATQLAHQIETEYGARAEIVAGDVSKTEDVEALFTRSVETYGAVDILINNAGVWPTAFVKDMTCEQWNKTLAVNLTGSFLTCREAVRRWRDAGRTGRIVNIVSPAAFRASTIGHADYAASKAGLVALTISLAREMAPHGIHVNAVAPGMMETDMTRDALARGRQKYLKRIPLGRIADAAEVAHVVTLLASDRASYITGATLDASGGMLMR